MNIERGIEREESRERKGMGIERERKSEGEFGVLRDILWYCEFQLQGKEGQSTCTPSHSPTSAPLPSRDDAGAQTPPGTSLSFKCQQCNRRASAPARAAVVEELDMSNRSEKSSRP